MVVVLPAPFGPRNPSTILLDDQVDAVQHFLVAVAHDEPTRLDGGAVAPGR